MIRNPFLSTKNTHSRLQENNKIFLILNNKKYIYPDFQIQPDGSILTDNKTQTCTSVWSYQYIHKHFSLNPTSTVTNSCSRSETTTFVFKTSSKSSRDIVRKLTQHHQQQNIQQSYKIVSKLYLLSC